MNTITPNTEAKGPQELLAEITDRHQRCRNSVVEACLTFPNVGAYIAQIEAERDVLLRQFGDVCSDCGALLTLCGPQDNDGEPTLDCQPCKLRAERDAALDHATKCERGTWDGARQLTAVTAERDAAVAKLRSLYPERGPCSRHRDPGPWDCDICWLDWRKLCMEHSAVSRRMVEERDAERKARKALQAAADALAADQSEAPHPSCGLVQPVTVADCEALNAALALAAKLP